MADTKITKKPTTKVSKLAIERTTVSGNTRTMKATWDIPSAATNEKSNARATKVRVVWNISKKSKKAKTNPKHTIDGGTGFKESNKGIGGTWGKASYTRDSFYPKTSWKIYSCWLNVTLGNTKGWGKAVSQTFKFEPPRVPTLGAWSFNNETGVASINIKTNAGTDKYERYDTRYKVHVTNTRSGYKGVYKDITTTSTDTNYTYNVGDYQQLDYNQYVKLTITAWARGLAGDSKTKAKKTIYVSYPAEPKISKSVVSGKEGHDKCTIYINTNYNPSKNINTAHPVDRVKLQYLTNVSYSDAKQIPGDADWKDSGIMDDATCSALAIGVADVLPDECKYTWVRVKSYHLNEDVLYRYSKPHRVTGLETPAPTAEDDDIVLIDAHAGSDGKSAVVTLGWNQDGQDDSTGTELSWSDELDTWKSTKDPESYRFTWSDAKEQGPLIVIIDGQEVTFNDHATLTIKGLAEGETYYIKARRYMEGDVETYSKYTKTGTVLTSERPETIVASCDRYVTDGNPLGVKWTFSGNGIQRAWQIVQTSNKYNPTTDEKIYILTQDRTYYLLTSDTEIDDEKTYYILVDDEYVEVDEPIVQDISNYYEKINGVVEGKTYYTRSGEEPPYTYTEVQNPTEEGLPEYYELTAGVVDGKTYYTRSGTEGAYVYTEVENPRSEDLDTYFEVSNGVVIAEGETTIGSTQVSYERLQTFAENGSLSFTVQASTGSAWVVSEKKIVGLIDSPILELDAPETMTAQPYTFTANSNRACDLTVIVKSDGISGQFPQGVEYQLEGDTVHSDVYIPEWTPTQDGFTADITLPAGLDFWDTGKYTMTVTGTDRGTGLTSEKQTAHFSVAWDHQAPDPTDFVTITPINETDKDGVHHIAAQIALTPPTGSAETDVYDIYRMDNENPQLIGADFPLDVTTTDEYAPFSDSDEVSYRIAIRTADGDVDFSDVSYTSEFKSLRLDWAEGYLELPYGISIGDSYKKDVDIRKHMDGTYDGYWNEGVERKGSLSTSIIKIVQPDDITKSRMLARYAGPVFVRTPNGSAYEAHVEVTDLSVKNRDVTAISLDCTEIGLTREFQLPPYIVEEEE